MIQALGGKLLDKTGSEIGQGGGSLVQLEAIDMSGLDSRLRDVHFEVACDVDNPLTGPRGASAIFGPQKGATPEMAFAASSADKLSLNESGAITIFIFDPLPFY